MINLGDKNKASSCYFELDDNLKPLAGRRENMQLTKAVALIIEDPLNLVGG
jgi:hypothetical protein